MLNKKSSVFHKIRMALWLVFLLAFLGFPVYLLTVKYNIFNLYGQLPSYKALENPESKNDLSSELISSDGVLLGKYYRFNRTQVSFDDLSPELVQTLLATEDIRFYEHAGIDLRGMLRVGFYSILLRRESAGGGSTISQQLAKNIFNTRLFEADPETEGLLHKINSRYLNLLISKTKEWIVAVHLESSFTKNEIMAMYLNTIFFGHNTYGIKVASRTFFNKEPAELNYQESALLVGMLNKPTRFSPINYPENALAKRNEILYNLHKYNYINRPVYDSIKTLPIELDYNIEDHVEGLAPYFRTAIRPYLLRWARENNIDLFESGLKIYTTIDSRMQRYAEESVKEHMTYLQRLFDEHWKGRNPWRYEDGSEIPGFVDNHLRRSQRYQDLVRQYGKDSDSIGIVLNTPVRMRIFSWTGDIDTLMSPRDSLAYYKKFLQTGFMAMDPKTGDVKAWVGGINYRHFQFDHVMQSKRQPGSTFKPVVYAAAIDNGYSPCYEVEDAPVTFSLPGQNPPVYTPQNYEKVFTGEVMTIRQGMARSKNSITAFLMQKLGPETIVRYARILGIESPLDPVPALCLGTSDVSVYELIGAYSTFANRGVWTAPHFITHIEDKYGNLLQEFPIRTREALSEETAFLMLHMLMGSTQERGGTALGLSSDVRHNNEIGAKTGTTQNASDGWFIGLTTDLAAGVWVGGDERSIHFRTSSLGQGARTAMPIYDKFMQKVYADKDLNYEKGFFPRPTRPLPVEIDCNRYKIGGTIPGDTVERYQPKENLKRDEIL
ncbi:MAG: transglycosylase domain-containing protein [Cyclobacteriaceae bacterium]|nr:transglycosylase domain-containing protein [Cyclobacteriaceae bacterium]